jgi:hypothetical protein
VALNTINQPTKLVGDYGYLGNRHLSFSGDYVFFSEEKFSLKFIENNKLI